MKALAPCACALCASCGTLFNSGPDTLRFVTDPPGATVTLDGAPLGVTPLTAPVRRKAAGIVSYELPGHRTVTLTLDTSFNGIAALNGLWLITIPGVICWVVDAASGNLSCWESPPPVQLVPVEGGTR